LPSRELEAHFPEAAHVAESQPFVKPHAGLVWRDDAGDDRVIAKLGRP
jgi:hypothetical protein